MAHRDCDLLYRLHRRSLPQYFTPLGKTGARFLGEAVGESWQTGILIDHGGDYRMKWHIPSFSENKYNALGYLAGAQIVKRIVHFAERTIVDWQFGDALLGQLSHELTQFRQRLDATPQLGHCQEGPEH
tara:strand:- start:506 stop:892 length:387 start_codon:yes stop_codon:yes gene_type:complete